MRSRFFPHVSAARLLPERVPSTCLPRLAHDRVGADGCEAYAASTRLGAHAALYVLVTRKVSLTSEIFGEKRP